MKIIETPNPSQIDVSVRILFKFKTNKAYPITSTCAILVNPDIKNSLGNEIYSNEKKIRLSHPCDIMELKVDTYNLNINKISIIRTSRRIIVMNI